MVNVELFVKEDCHLCDKALNIIKEAQRVIPFKLSIVDISRNERLIQELGEEIPIVFINGTKSFRFFVDKDEFIKRILIAQEKT